MIAEHRGGSRSRRPFSSLPPQARPTAAQLLARVPWHEDKPTEQAALVPILTLGRIRVSEVSTGYWQYLVRSGLVLDVDSQSLVLDAPNDVDETPRVLTSLTGILPESGDLVDLDAFVLEAIHEPIALIALDLFARSEIGATDAALATHAPLEQDVRWTSGVAGATFEKVAVTRRQWNIGGTSGGWRRVECAVRLQANDRVWCFERIPLSVTGEPGIALS